MRRKRFFIPIIFVLVLAMTAGCGNAKNTENESPAAVAEPEATLPAVEEIKSEEIEFPDHIITALYHTGHTEADITGNQLIVVTSNGNTTELNCYEKKNNSFVMIEHLSSISADVGYAGVGLKDHEGDGVSPEGLWDIDFAFGRKENPGTSLEYIQVTENSYWVDDPNSIHYNRWVEGEPDGSWTSAEHLNDYEAYNYALVIEYNYENPVQGAGSAIFLHCGNGSTLGCIAVPEDYMKQILQWVQDDVMILIVGLA